MERSNLYLVSSQEEKILLKVEDFKEDIEENRNILSHCESLLEEAKAKKERFIEEKFQSDVYKRRAVYTERKEQLQIIISYIESSYGRPVNNNDLVIINNWLDLGYPIEDIKEAILDSLKAKKLHLRYADAILASRHKQRETVDEIDEEGAELLASIYVKK
jgi:DNA-binding transcriptional MerR regulator